MDRIDILRNLMKEKNMNVADISKAVDLPYTTVKTIMDKGIGKASYINISLICKALGITTDELENLTNDINDKNESKKESTLEIDSLEWLHQGLIARGVIKEDEDLTRDKLEIILSNVDILVHALKQKVKK